MKLFLHQLAVLGILVFAYLLQIQIIAPLEGWLQGGSALAAGSLLFLPFGASVVCVELSGVKAYPTTDDSSLTWPELRFCRSRVTAPKPRTDCLYLARRFPIRS